MTLRLVTVLGCIFCYQLISLGQINFELVPSKNSWNLIVKSEQKLLDRDLLKVFTGKHSKEKQPTLLGMITEGNGSLIFTPQFGFQPLMEYHAVYDKKVIFHFDIPVPEDIPVPKCWAIYPSGDSLPANWLKIYLHFNTPMSESWVYDKVKVIEDLGDTLKKPFVELDPPLWNAEKNRLTLWFDPGRIKRALGPNDKLGTPLTAGRSYRIIIDKDWKDAWNRPLEENMEKEYWIVMADRSKPRLENWKIVLPKHGSKEPLEIIFGESMDHALLAKAFEIKDKIGRSIDCKKIIGKEEKEVFLFPVQPWSSYEYELWVQAALEDVSGNNLNRLFDKDLYQKSSIVQESDVYRLPLHLEK